MQDEKILMELARLILPSGFVENFKITSIVSNESDIEMNCVKIQIKIKLKSRYIQNCFLQSQRSVSVTCSQQQSISL